MTSRTQTIVLAAALALATSGIYLWRLQDAPIHLTRAEAFVSLTAQSLAVKGRDLDGHFMPLYFYSKVHGDWWWPILPYVTAGALQVLPFSERSVRTPMAVAAILNVVLVFLIGRLLFDRKHLALVPAVLLAIAPPQVIYNRYANDSGLPATFALLWMLAGFAYLRAGSARALFAAGVVLGVGFYSYVGAVLTMPLYLLLTGAALMLRREPPTRYLTLAAGFVIPMALGLPWLSHHPDVFRAAFLDYQSNDFANADAFTALRLFGTLRRAAQIGLLYVHFWDPSFLFIHGAPTLMHSTGRVGVFLVPVAGLLVVGIILALRRAISDGRALLLLGGFLLAPLPASTVDFNDHLAMHAIWRAVEVVPFGALLAGLGIERSLAGAPTHRKQFALCIALAIPLCLLSLYREVLPDGSVLLLGLLAPLAIAALSILLSMFLGEASHRDLPRRRVFGVAIVGLVGAQLAFFFIDRFSGGQPTPLLLAGAVAASVVVALLLRRVPSKTHRIVASAAVALGTVSLLQFADFYADYMTDYRARFAETQTDGNTRDVLEAIIGRSPAIEPARDRVPPAIYLGFRLGVGDWGSYYWLFYLHEHHREDLILRTINDRNASQFNHDRICHLPPDSLVATRFGWDPATDRLIERMTAGGELILDVLLRGEPSYWLLRTTGSCMAE